MRGYIGLQNHGVAAEFRNVRLLRLNESIGSLRRETLP